MALITTDEINKVSQLWSRQSDDWHEARKKDWTLNKLSFLHKVPKNKHKFYRSYFLSGDDEVYIPAVFKLWMTPIVQPGDAAVAFDYVAKKSGGTGGHAGLQASCIEFVSMYEIRCQTCPDMIKLFCSEVLGDEYAADVKLETGTTFSAARPGRFASGYLGALLYFFCKDTGVDDVAYGFDYFLSDLKAGIEKGGYIGEPQREAFIRQILKIKKAVCEEHNQRGHGDNECRLTAKLNESMSVIENILRVDN